jgi:hypothetical protein
MKWILIGTLLLAVVVVGIAIYSNWIANPRVAAELEASPEGDRAEKVMLLTLPNGRTVPVNYLREGQTVYAGADGPWWRGLRRRGARVELLIQGEHVIGHAVAIEDDPEHTRAVFERLRPTVPRWLPDWLDAVLVEIRLQGSEPVER